MLKNQMPVPPVDMVMSPYYPVVLAITSSVALAVAAWMVVEARRSKRALPIFVVLGAMLSVFLEPIYDIAGAVWWPETGHTPMFRFFNASVPYWVMAVYVIYVGGLSYFLYKKITSGLPSGQIWKLYLLFLVTNLIIEVPVLSTGSTYVYYGDQPFMFFGFPLWWGMTNSLIPIFIAAALTALDDLLTGWRSILAIPLVPMVMGSAEISAGGPAGSRSTRREEVVRALLEGLPRRHCRRLQFISLTRSFACA